VLPTLMKMKIIFFSEFSKAGTSTDRSGYDGVFA